MIFFIIVSCSTMKRSNNMEPVISDLEFNQIVFEKKLNSNVFISIWTINNGTKSRYILQLDNQVVNISRLSYDGSIDHFQVREYPTFTKFIKYLIELPQKDTVIDIISEKYPFDDRLDCLYLYNELNGCEIEMVFTTHDYDHPLYKEFFVPLKNFLLEVEIEYPRKRTIIY